VEAEHSAPKSRKGRRRWPKRLNAYRKTFIPAQWQALMQAEADFADTQTALVAVRAAAMGDLQTMIAAAELYDGIELCRINRAPTARAVVAYFAKTARGGAVMNSGISEEAKRAIANGTRRRAADRLDRDGCHSMDVVRRRVRALPQERNLQPGRLCQADAADDQGGEGRTA
jgi:hypothetical protein